MSGRVNRRVGVIEGVIVLVVGILVLTVVVGLKLIPRLSDGQKVLDSSRPVFAADRLTADKAGIDLISKDVDMATPIVTAKGGGAAEVPAIIAYIAKTQHISQAQALALAQKTFPHTTALLQAIPLSSVTSELPGLLAFLEKTLKVDQAQMLGALSKNFPAITQAVTNLPTVTNGWDHIPGVDGMTRFNGTPVTSVPDMRDYFKDDLIPAAAANRDNFNSLDSKTNVDWIAPLLLIVSIIVILFAILMIVRSVRGVSRGEARAYGIVVAVVGVAIVALVLVIDLTPRVSNGQKLLDNLEPAFAANRVQGARVGVNMVDAIAKTEDPIMTPQGGAAAEVPKLIAFVSQQTGLSPAAVVAALQKNFPHTTALLQAIPISAVSDELPAVTKFLAPAIPAIPALVPTVTNAPDVTAGWNTVPGIGNATNNAGDPIKSVPDIVNYYSKNVIPVLESQRTHYDNLTSISKINFLGPLVLIVGIIVIIYGLLMVFLAGGPPRPRRETAAGSAPAASSAPA